LEDRRNGRGHAARSKQANVGLKERSHPPLREERGWELGLSFMCKGSSRKEGEDSVRGTALPLLATTCKLNGKGMGETNSRVNGRRMRQGRNPAGARMKYRGEIWAKGGRRARAQSGETTQTRKYF